MGTQVLNISTEIDQHWTSKVYMLTKELLRAGKTTHSAVVGDITETVQS